MSVPISVEPASTADSSQELSLGQLISRVTQERGSFAGLDEQKLEDSILYNEDDEVRELNEEKEIENGAIEDGEGSQVENDENEEEKKSVESVFHEKRAELSAAVNAALNEAALNLDFVSMLVSATRADAGTSTMSPALRSQIPPASLNALPVQTHVPSLENVAGYGWKIDAYERASKQLTESSERLSKEADLEAQFWTDVLETVQSGETVNSRMQIKYGFMDSGSEYRDKGYGRIIRKSDGHAEFVPDTNHENKVIEVKVYSKNSGDPVPETELDTEPMKLIGRASLANTHTHTSKILQDIACERNKVFEEELMYNMIQETRNNLASRQVKIIDNGTIVCDLFGGKITIELVDADTPNEVNDLNTNTYEASNPDDMEIDLSTNENNVNDTETDNSENPAVCILYALHLLQIDAYKRNLDKTQQIPPPLRLIRKQEDTKSDLASETEFHILGPMLSFVQHGILVNRVLKMFEVMHLSAEIQDQSEGLKMLHETPKCTALVKSSINPTQELNVEISTSLLSKEPEFTVKRASDESRSSINDLIELEAWLRWAVSS